MARINLQTIKFSKVYPMYVQKVERKGRTKEELDELAKGKKMEKIKRE